jgi:hypothetical protein
MPIRFTIDHAKRLVTARAEDEISLKDIEEFTDAIMVENAMPYRKLFDGRTAFGRYDDHDLMQLAARMSAYASAERRGALALLPSPEYLELSRRFINLGKSGRPAKIFDDEASALRWLMAQPEA